MHIIPVHFFDQFQVFESLNRFEKTDFQPINISRVLSDRPNFDGHVLYNLLGDEHSFSYTQIFRNAVIEFVDTHAFHNNLKTLFQSYEKQIVKALGLYCPSLVKKTVNGSCTIFLSILGIKGYKIIQNNTVLFDKENLFLPDIYIEDMNDFLPEEVMKPAFDMVWNACGHSGSKNYDKKGKWNPPKE